MTVIGQGNLKKEIKCFAKFNKNHIYIYIFLTQLDLYWIGFS